MHINNFNYYAYNKMHPIKSKCFIGGCTRNCGKYIHDVFTNIIKISNMFEEVYIIISYDNSNDNTLKALEEQKKRIPNMEIIINTEQLSNIITKNISNARNRIMEYINKNYTTEWEYFIMMDMDEMCSLPIDIDVLYNYLFRDDWDGLSFNRKIYYDIWALSYDPYVISCWNWGDYEKSRDVCCFMHYDIMNKLNNMRKDELFLCNSAFNGFSIYRLSKFIDCRYDWISLDFEKIPIKFYKELTEKFKLIPVYKEHREDCEHREFHRQAIEKHDAKICISPLYIFDYPTEYSSLD